LKILVGGTGGVGGYYGARLLAAGNDVWFMARGRTLDALQERGLTLSSDLGDLAFASVNAVEAGANAGIADLVLFCVKTYDNEPGAGAVAGAVGRRTLVLSLQNGVENEAFLADRFPRADVLAGVARVEAWVEEPGLIRQRGPQTNLTIGPIEGEPSGRTRDLAAAIADAGVPCEASADMPTALWWKLLGICGVGGVTAYCRCPIGEVLRDPELNDLITGCWNEAFHVARATGVALPDDTVATMTHYATQVLNLGLKSSMCRDVERGRPLEVEAINGAVTRFGKEAGIETPANRQVLDTLLPLHRAAMARRRGG